MQGFRPVVTVSSLLQAVPWIGLAYVALLYLRLNSGTWVITPDSATYVEGTRALAALRGYVDATGRPITFFPPGTSAVYAVAALIPSGDFTYFNLTSKILAISFVWLSFLVIQRSAGGWVALLAALFLALSATLLLESTRILSDVAFSAAFMLTLWLFPAEKLEDMQTRSALVLGLLVSCCYVLRTAGIFVVAAYMAYIISCVRVARARSLTVLAATFVAVAVPLWLRSWQFADQYSYTKIIFMREAWVIDSGRPNLLDWYQRVLANVVSVVRGTYEIFSNLQNLRLYGSVIAVLMILGVLVATRRRRSWLHLLCLCCYVPVLLVHMFDRRYLLPVVPLLVLLVFDGAAWVVGWFEDRRARCGVSVILVLLLCVNPYWFEGVSYARRLRARLDAARGTAVIYPGHEAFLDLVRQYDGNLSNADVVGTMHADVLRYFLSGKARVWSLPIRLDVDESYREIKDAGTTYLFCDKSVAITWTHLEPVIRTYRASFQLLAENPIAAIYRVVP